MTAQQFRDLDEFYERVVRPLVEDGFSDEEEKDAEDLYHRCDPGFVCSIVYVLYHRPQQDRIG